MQVVLTGSDGATYTYGGGQVVNVHWGEQHPDGGAQAVRVHPGEQVMAGQELLEAGWAGFSLKIIVPDVASPVCVAAGAGILGGGHDGGCARAYRPSGAGAWLRPATATGQPVVIIADPPSAGMANQMSHQLTDEHLRSQVVTLSSPLAQVPTSQWPAVIDQAVTNAKCDPRGGGRPVCISQPLAPRAWPPGSTGCWPACQPAPRFPGPGQPQPSRLRQRRHPWIQRCRRRSPGTRTCECRPYSR